MDAHHAYDARRQRLQQLRQKRENRSCMEIYFRMHVEQIYELFGRLLEIGLFFQLQHQIHFETARQVHDRAERTIELHL